MISIVVPCFNCANSIQKTIDSLLNQTYGDYEVVLVNDGSKDETGTVLDEVAGRDSRVRVIHQSNGGLLNAWKAGVRGANGDYILFCDADDYIEKNTIEVLEQKLQANPADIVLYGYLFEYEDGSQVLSRFRLDGGYYDRSRLENDILPRLFSDGTMESMLIPFSRWSKLFSKKLLMKVLDSLDDRVSIGEDAITNLATILNADSLLVLDDFYPYHYVRNSASMIGSYDERCFEKLELLYRSLSSIGQLYGYKNRDQIAAGFLSVAFIFMKKEICRNPKGKLDSTKKLRDFRESSEVSEALSLTSVDDYKLMSRIFAKLIINNHFNLAYVITRAAAGAGAGKD